jgi:hypothetical protein
MISNPDTMELVVALKSQWDDDTAKSLAKKIAEMCFCETDDDEVRGKPCWNSEKACCDEVLSYLHKLKEDGGEVTGCSSC